MLMRTEEDIYNFFFEKKKKKKDCNVMTEGRQFLDQPIKNDIKAYENIQKIATGDDYKTGYLLEYLYFKQNLVNSK